LFFCLIFVYQCLFGEIKIIIFGCIAHLKSELRQNAWR